MVASSVPPSPEGAKPRRPSRRTRRLAVPALRARWKVEADAGTVSNVYRLPLSSLLLSGLTLGADEGPGLDVLIAAHETLEGWRRAAPEGATITVALGEVMLLARRLEVAMELVRRGAGAFATPGE